jgi:hypothetical protein
MSGGIIYIIEVTQEYNGPGRYQWSYECQYQGCVGQKHQIGPTSEAAAMAARNHAKAVHEGDHADIMVEDSD